MKGKLEQNPKRYPPISGVLYSVSVHYERREPREEKGGKYRIPFENERGMRTKTSSGRRRG